MVFVCNAIILNSGTSTYADYTISMTSSGVQSVDVAPANSSIGTKISEDAISITTTCPSGYNLGISTSVNDNNLYLEGDSSSNSHISPSNGSTALGSATNTWGYYYDSSNSTVPTASSVFSAVPTSSTTVKSSPNTSDSFSIYYGVAVDSTLAPGKYKMIPDTNNSNTNGTIVYYLTMAEACLPYTVNFNPTSTAGGQTISGTGTMNSQSMPVGIATALNSNTYTAPAGYEFDSWNTAQDGTGTSYQDGANVTNLTSGGQTITLYAQWKIASYTITYSSNGGTGTVSEQTVTQGSSVTLRDNGFARTNYYFKGWGTNTSIVTYRTNQSITPTGNMTLYAIWGSSTSTTLYDIAASLTRGTQTLANLRTDITKTNSGVYTYDTSVFGAASDASASNSIYYYRGILDNVVGSRGSDGDAMNYPNYVLLGGKNTSNTCWRIVRTTGSGGVKMIYNGKWAGSTCANSQTNAQVTTSAFDTTADSGGRSIVGVGYTYNASYKSTRTSTAYSTLFGSNTSYSGNSTSSTLKTYIEGTWFANINSYASKLEQSAGWCNDRTIRTSEGSTSVIPNNTTISDPYEPNGYGTTDYYFGPNVRTMSTKDKPTLGCPRSGADLYTTSSASNGNKQLGKPAAPITADEAVLAGSGFSSSTTPYHTKSYLNSGSSFILLSPKERTLGGMACVLFINGMGQINRNYVHIESGVRPSISLKSGTMVTSGSGTATDPWIVNP